LQGSSLILRQLRGLTIVVLWLHGQVKQVRREPTELDVGSVEHNEGCSSATARRGRCLGLGKLEMKKLMRGLQFIGSRLPKTCGSRILALSHLGLEQKS
jgi:hypothetical protein